MNCKHGRRIYYRSVAQGRRGDIHTHVGLLSVNLTLFQILSSSLNIQSIYMYMYIRLYIMVSRPLLGGSCFFESILLH